MSLRSQPTLDAVDLLTVLAPYTNLRRTGSTNGGEWAGPCPFCGGRDRFRVWPNAKHPRWWCRQCKRRGDAITLLQEVEGMSFSEACAYLGRPVPERRLPPDKNDPRPTVREDGPPSEAWQRRATDLVNDCYHNLWTDHGLKAREYLTQRGLSEDTMKLWGLGYNLHDIYEEPGRWGLSEGKRIWCPRGIVIPCIVAGTIWSVKIRRPPPHDGPKYIGPRGGRPGLFGADTCCFDARARGVAVLTEGEFDAMLLFQEAEDLVGVATLGSATARLTSGWMWALRNTRRVLVAYDLDAAGMGGAEAQASLSARMRVVRPIGAKDLSEMHRQGGSLRDWVLCQLQRHA